MLNVLEDLNFLGLFIQWIKLCIASPLFSVMINGGLEGCFKERKVYEKETLCHLNLFVLVVNVLCKMLDDAAKKKSLSYYPLCSILKANTFMLCR